MGKTHNNNPRLRSAYTLLDVLVTMLIVAVLIGILMPTVSKVQESARKVVCQSNIRQLGVATLMYADTYNGYLPPSIMVDPTAGGRTEKMPQDMIYARLELSSGAPAPGWDGLGHLYERDFLPAQGVFYCPSHSGVNRAEDMAAAWQQNLGQIPTNYHYRGEGPTTGAAVNGVAPTTRQLFRIDPAQTSLIADAMRSQADVNHRVGANYFRADLTVHWYSDTSGNLRRSVGADGSTTAANAVTALWQMFDQSTSSQGPLQGQQPGPG